MDCNKYCVAGLGSKSELCCSCLEVGRLVGAGVCRMGRQGAEVCIVLGRAAVWISRHGPTHWHRAWKVKNLW